MGDYDIPVGMNIWGYEHKTRSDVTPVVTKMREPWYEKGKLVSNNKAEYTNYVGMQQSTVGPKNGHKPTSFKGADIGGYFFSRKLITSLPTGDMHLISRANRFGYDMSTIIEGSRWPCYNSHSASRTKPNKLEPLGGSGLSIPALLGLGSTGIARSLPTVPPASLAVTLGEIKEGLPKLPGKALLKARSDKKFLSASANEFLNLQFGILPVISDIKNIIDASKNGDEFLRKLHRDENTLVRRRRTLLDVSEVVETGSHRTNVFPFGYTYCDRFGNTTGDCVIHTKMDRKIWFSGAFTYKFPRLEGWYKELVEFDRVYGIIPNAAAAWELIPYSWLVDWFTNVGDVIKNITYLGGRDGLMLQYGYIMAETRVEKSHTNNGLNATIVETNKQRLSATPFGFGLDPGLMSPKQLAILASLGISRMRV